MNKKGKRRGRGEGSVFQRKDGLWVGEITVGYNANGKAKRKTKYGASKSEVLEKLRDLQAKIHAGTLEEGTMRTGNALDFWVVGMKHRVAGATYHNYLYYIENHIKPHLGHLQLGKLTVFHISQWYQDLTTAGVHQSVQRMAGKVLRTFLTHCQDVMGLVRTNVAMKFPLPAKVRRPFTLWTKPQVGAFLQAAEDNRLYSLFVTALDSGARQGELLALTRDDVDLVAGTLLLVKSLWRHPNGQFIVKDTKTAKSRRLVKLSDGTVTILRDHLSSHSWPTVWTNRKGNYVSRGDMTPQYVRPLCLRAGVPVIRFHDLRHMAASYLLLAGVHVKVVAERLGHSNISVTLDTYSHLFPTTQNEAALQMGRFLADCRGTVNIQKDQMVSLDEPGLNGELVVTYE